MHKETDCVKVSIILTQKCSLFHSRQRSLNLHDVVSVCWCETVFRIHITLRFYVKGKFADYNQSCIITTWVEYVNEQWWTHFPVYLHPDVPIHLLIKVPRIFGGIPCRRITEYFFLYLLGNLVVLKALSKRTWVFWKTWLCLIVFCPHTNSFCKIPSRVMISRNSVSMLICKRWKQHFCIAMSE